MTYILYRNKTRHRLNFSFLSPFILIMTELYRCEHNLQECLPYTYGHREPSKIRRQLIIKENKERKKKNG
jgi:hypothetical protein